MMKMYMNKAHVKSIGKTIYFFVAAILFQLFFSGSTSPLYPQMGADSIGYMMIGRSFIYGHMPYTQMSDNKGPLMYYFQALGQLPGYREYGTLVLQIVLMTITLVILSKCIEVLVGKSCFLLIPVFYLVPLICWFEFGNLTEEYSILFVILAFYQFVKFWVNKEQNYKKTFFVQGICFGAVAMIRMNDCLSIAVMILLTFILAIKERWGNRKKCIGYSILMGLSGCMSIVGICLFPYGVTGTFNYVISDYLFISREFVSIDSNNMLTNRWTILTTTIFGKLSLVILSLVILSTLLGCLEMMKHEGRFRTLIFSTCGIGITLSFIISSIVKASGRMHYAMFLAISCIYCMMMFLYWLNNRKKQNIALKPIIIILIIITLVRYPVQIIKQTYDWDSYLRTSDILKKQARDIIELGKYVTDNKDEVCVLGVSPLFYWLTDTTSTYRYLFPASLISMSETIREDFDNYLYYDSPKWLVITMTEEGELDTWLSQGELSFIEDTYTIVKTNDCGALMKNEKK